MSSLSERKSAASLSHRFGLTPDAVAPAWRSHAGEAKSHVATYGACDYGYSLRSLAVRRHRKTAISSGISGDLPVPGIGRYHKSRGSLEKGYPTRGTWVGRCGITPDGAALSEHARRGRPTPSALATVSRLMDGAPGSATARTQGDEGKTPNCQWRGLRTAGAQIPPGRRTCGMRVIPPTRTVGNRRGWRYTTPRGRSLCRTC